MNETIKSLEVSVRVSCHGAFLAHHISHVVRLSSIIFHFHNESHIFHHHQRERTRNFFPFLTKNRFTSRLRGFSFVLNFHCYSTLGANENLLLALNSSTDFWISFALSSPDGNISQLKIKLKCYSECFNFLNFFFSGVWFVVSLWLNVKCFEKRRILPYQLNTYF